MIVFGFALFVFNGRFIYTQLKYHFIGPPLIHETWSTKQGAKSEVFERVVIPLIGIDAPIIVPESADEYTIQKALEQGVVNYPDSNIILGHSSAYPWYKGEYGSIFSLINKLEKGDEFFIFSNKKKYTYQVLEKEIKLPKDLSFSSANDKSIVYLVSCWPINTAWKRIVIKADLLDKN